MRVDQHRLDVVLAVSYLDHGDVLFYGLWRVLLVVLVLHVSPPIVFPWERLATLFRIGAAAHCAMVLPGFVVFVVDVSIQVGFGPESLVTLSAVMWSFVVSLVMTAGCKFYIQGESEQELGCGLLQLVDLIKFTATFVAAKGFGLGRGPVLGCSAWRWPRTTYWTFYLAVSIVYD